MLIIFLFEIKLDINENILYNNRVHLQKGGEDLGSFKENFKTYLEKTDIWLWIFTFVATIYSLLLISDMQRAGEYNYLFTQIVAVLIGIAFAVLISLVNYKYFIKYINW